MIAFISYPPIPIFDLGPLTLSLHGVFAALGFLAGAYAASRLMRRRGYDVEKYQSVLTWALVGSLLGARWFTLPAHFAANGFDIGEFVNVGGNYSIMGGFAGGILVGAYRMRKVGLAILPTLDISTFGLAIGTIVGRIGDLAIVEHLGGPTDFFLGYAVKPGYDLAPQHDVLECTAAEAVDGICGVYHHTALYDMAGAVALLGALWWVYNRSGWRLRYGQLFFGWVAWYGVQRFLIDFARLALDVGGDATLGPLTWNQWSALLAAVLAAAIFWQIGRKGEPVTPEGDRERGAVLVGAGRDV